MPGLWEQPESRDGFEDLIAAIDREDPWDCPARSQGTHHCLRADGHPGRHIALGMEGVIAAWPGTETPTLADLGAEQ